jgi:hypothetical protein
MAKFPVVLNDVTWNRQQNDKMDPDLFWLVGPKYGMI